MYADGHAQTALRLIFKQRANVAGALPLLVRRVGERGHCRAPRHGAADGVDPIGLVAVKLRDQLCIGGLSAAGTCAGELQQRQTELAALHRLGIKLVALVGKGQRILPILGLFQQGGSRRHVDGLLLGGAAGHAAATARAVHRADLQAVAIRCLGALQRRRLKSLRCLRRLLLIQQERPDHRMGAYIGALVALQALRSVPHRDLRGDAALFKHGVAHLEGTALVTHESADRQIIAPLCRNGHDDVAHLFRQLFQIVLFLHGILPCRRHLHQNGTVDTGVHGGQIHGHHLFTLAGKGLLRRLLHVSHRVLHRDHLCQLEERRLQDHAGLVAQTQLLRDLVGVHDVETDLIFRQIALHLCRQHLIQLLHRPLRVQQEGAALLQLVDHVIFSQIRLIMASNKISALHQIRGADGRFAEPQMGFCDTKGLLCVVLKIRLRIHVRMVAHDLGGVLVGAHRAVAAQTPELAGDGVGRLRLQRRAGIQ